MTNFNNRHNMNRSTSMHETPTSFKIMFRVVATFVVLIFIATITVMILTFTGNAPFSYHYEVNYGNGSYSETTTWDDNE